MTYQHITVPEQGSKITVNTDLSLNVPNDPIIPYIEGDGIGFDVSPVMLKVVDAAVEKAFNGTKNIHWMEVYAGEKATVTYDADTWMPEETLAAFKEYKVGIKGPLTTPVGGGIRSLECSSSPRTRLICMSASGSLVYRRTQPCAKARKRRHDYLP